MGWVDNLLCLQVKENKTKKWLKWSGLQEEEEQEQTGGNSWLEHKKE